jgi:hypothetical protein
MALLMAAGSPYLKLTVRSTHTRRQITGLSARTAACSSPGDPRKELIYDFFLLVFVVWLGYRICSAIVDSANSSRDDAVH